MTTKKSGTKKGTKKTVKSAVKAIIREEKRAPPVAPKPQSAWKPFVGTIAKAASTFIHPLAGSAIKNFAKVWGHGTYHTRTGGVLREGNSPPMFDSNSVGTRVSHREFVGNITGSTGFLNTGYTVNPGNPQLFPWLAQIANCYSEYRMNGCIFEFKSTSADALNSTNTALGTVIAAADYNPVNANFGSQLQMENYEYATAAKPSSSFFYALECARNQTPVQILNVNNGPALPNGADPRLYNFANFQLATIGMQAAAVIGQLWVTYDVTFMKPQLDVNTPAAPPAGLLYAYSGQTISGGWLDGTTLPIGYGNQPNNWDRQNFIGVSSSLQTLGLAGHYALNFGQACTGCSFLVALYLQCTGTSLSSFTATPGNTSYCTVSSFTPTIISSSSPYNIMLETVVTVIQGLSDQGTYPTWQANVSFSYNGSITSWNKCQLYVVQVPNAYVSLERTKLKEREPMYQVLKEIEDLRAQISRLASGSDNKELEVINEVLEPQSPTHDIPARVATPTLRSAPTEPVYLSSSFVNLLRSSSQAK